MRRSHRFTTLSQLGFTLLALTSCAEPSDVPPNERAGVSVASVSDSCRSVGLKATKNYSPTLWFDTERSLSSPVKFALPAEIAVLAGNAGNQESTFQYWLGVAGALVSCTYRGGADDAHPVSAAEVIHIACAPIDPTVATPGLYAEQDPTGVSPPYVSGHLASLPPSPSRGPAPVPRTLSIMARIDGHSASVTLTRSTGV